MKKDDKLDVLNKIKELIPQHIYICVCYHFVIKYFYQDLEHLQKLKDEIPELYAEIKKEIERTHYDDYGYSFSTIHYPNNEKITNRIALIDRVIKELENN